MKARKKDQRGALGNIVASHNRFGDYDRDRVSPTQQSTRALDRAWGNMTDLSGLWNEITEEQREAWRRHSLTPTPPPFAVGYWLSRPQPQWPRPTL